MKLVRDARAVLDHIVDHYLVRYAAYLGGCSYLAAELYARR